MIERNETIDVAKGIGICLVVFFHCNIGEMSNGLHILVYSFHMPLFFILAGICFSRRYNFTNFAKRRAQRLLVPCFFFTIINLSFMCLLHLNSMYDSVFRELPMHIPGALWFLNVLFLSEIICYPIILYGSKYVYLVFLISFGSIGMLISSRDLHIPQSMGSVPLSCFYVLLGNLIKPQIHYLKSVRLWHFFLFIIVWFVIVRFFKVDVHLYDGMSEPLLYSEVASILGVIVCLTFSQKIVTNKLGGGMMLLGKKSLEIMVTHQIFIVSFKTLFWSNDFKDSQIWVFSFVQLFVTLIGTYIGVWFVDNKVSWLIGIKDLAKYNQANVKK